MAGPTSAVEAVRLSHLLLALVLLTGLSGYLLAAPPARIVYHLHQVQLEALPRILYNIENLYRGLDQGRPEIHMLLQGESLKLLRRGRLPAAYRQRLIELLRKGLVLETGEDNFRRQRKDLDPAFPLRLNRNILSRLVDLQKQGYRYLTP